MVERHENDWRHGIVRHSGVFEDTSLNNNRGNNRRRSRGNSRPQGQQVNRVDSRARGNAPQMLEKYKKLAHDAHLNGDRVQEEYYLQFADHYFRVLADQRQRQEDLRQRRDDRGPENGDPGRSDEPRYRDDDEFGDEPEDTVVPVRAERARPVEPEEVQAKAPEEAIYEPPQNPFVRDNSAVRAAVKPRKPRRTREASPEGSEGEPQELNLGVDPSVLPPSIGAEKAAVEEPEAEAKPRRRTRKPKVAEDKPTEDPGEKLEAVN